MCVEKNEETCHLATTKQIVASVREMATELRDTRILAKLWRHDCMIIAAYHKQCLVHFRIRYRTLVRKTESKQTSVLVSNAIKFAERFSFIEETHQAGNQSEHIFKLSTLVQLYR